MKISVKLVLVVILTLVLSQASSQCRIKNISDSLAGITNAFRPRISGKNIVWTARNGNTTDVSNLYLYKDGMASEVAGPDNAFIPEIDGDYIAYQAGNSVYLYNDTTTIDIAAPVTSNLHVPHEIRIHNGTVVWEGKSQQDQIANGQSNIFMYNDGALTVITQDIDKPNREPRLSDRYVVWTASGTSRVDQIFAYDRLNNEQFIVSEQFGNVSANNHKYDVHQDIIVWLGEDTNTDFTQVYKYKGDSLLIIDEPSQTNFVDRRIGALTTSVYGQTTTWARRKNGFPQVFLNKKGNTTCITDTLNGERHQFPKVHNDFMAWLSLDSAGLKLFYWEGGVSAPVELSRMVPNAPLARVGFGKSFTDLFDIWNNQVVWVAEVNGVNQIFHADCSLECPDILRLEGIVNQPGTEILYSAADTIYTSQRLLNGILTLDAPNIEFDDPFEVLNQSALEVSSDGCQ